MTRKRFVKLAMYHGIQRNNAEKLTEKVTDAGSYEALFIREESQWIVTQIAKEMCRFGITAKEAEAAFNRFALYTQERG